LRPTPKARMPSRTRSRRAVPGRNPQF
jgi:hypothetical protein